ncbi:MAG: hypothetical protein COW79_01445 [Bdellovibrionales bacterium CG22_combo_CG10-13_8_21_14_all_38_13]|nr:MAG: hypothetical protein COW79_01445 [Bdellovibrionales bacterium CG22_combo_CG10-13_8_21_14_all_38_13]
MAHGRARKNLEDEYSQFDQIDGRHPLQKALPEMVVSYRVRERKGARIAYFNFHLAKEMGLLPADQDEVMTPALEKKLLETFSIIIINEFDEMNGRKFPEKEIKPHRYMATRYLQLQHPNKTGKTSGDGRSVWNGQFKGKGGKVWDLSSCGSGATCLSPATAIQGKFFESGDPSISYGCGYSELDEGFSTAFFSEIMHRNGYSTERALLVLDYGGKIGLTVRVHPNLLRPSHFFAWLKQSDQKALEKLVDQWVFQQVKNKVFVNLPKTKAGQYKLCLDWLTDRFARTSARFEDDYIFCWLDWDGDNILMDGGIIDYGSIRQFGLFHSEYRYDDVERYSTTIVEQKQKAKYLVQTFAQMFDYLKTSQKKNIKEFSNHSSMTKFDEIFEEQKDINLLEKIGFNQKHTELLLTKYRSDVYEFRKVFAYFETAKSSEGLIEVADGVNRNAIFCMRDILRELPQLLLARGVNARLDADEFIEIIRSSYANDDDVKLTPTMKSKITQFQDLYLKLVELVGKTSTVLLTITMRSSVINKYDRVTGDAVTTVVDKVMNARPKLSANDMYDVLREFTEFQNLDPDLIQKRDHNKKSNRERLMKTMVKIVREYREGL